MCKGTAPRKRTSKDPGRVCARASEICDDSPGLPHENLPRKRTARPFVRSCRSTCPIIAAVVAAAAATAAVAPPCLPSLTPLLHADLKACSALLVIVGNSLLYQPNGFVGEGIAHQNELLRLLLPGAKCHLKTNNLNVS